MGKKVTVHYRRLVDRNLNDVDFLPAFQGGLAGHVGGVRLDTSDASRITVSSDGFRMCLLSPQTHPVCFGEIAVFRDGDVPIAETDGAGHVVLRTIPLAGNEEAVRGSTYFMARGPHLALLHHESSTRFLEDYVRWLMRAPIGPLAYDEMLSLQPLIEVGGQPVAVRSVRSLKIRAEVERGPPVGPAGRIADAGTSFARMIERQSLSGPDARSILRAIGLTDGSLHRLADGDLEDLEFELLVRKRERKKIQPLPDELIQGVFSDGIDRAAEIETAGARRRGEAIVASYTAEVDVVGAYYDLRTVRLALWAALGEWTNQGLI